jgi:hypothetical protein
MQKFPGELQKSQPDEAQTLLEQLTVLAKFSNHFEQLTAENLELKEKIKRGGLTLQALEEAQQQTEQSFKKMKETILQMDTEAQEREKIIVQLNSDLQETKEKERKRIDIARWKWEQEVTVEQKEFMELKNHTQKLEKNLVHMQEKNHLSEQKLQIVEARCQAREEEIQQLLIHDQNQKKRITFLEKQLGVTNANESYANFFPDSYQFVENLNLNSQRNHPDGSHGRSDPSSLPESRAYSWLPNTASYPTKPQGAFDYPSRFGSSEKTSSFPYDNFFAPSPPPPSSQCIWPAQISNSPQCNHSSSYQSPASSNRPHTPAFFYPGNNISTDPTSKRKREVYPERTTYSTTPHSDGSQHQTRPKQRVDNSTPTTDPISKKQQFNSNP